MITSTSTARTDRCLGSDLVISSSFAGLVLRRACFDFLRRFALRIVSVLFPATSLS